MADLALDHAKKWPPLPDWENAVLAGDGITLRSVTGLSQHLVSGDLKAFASAHGTGEGVGALGLASGTPYAARMARDRMVVIGIDDAALRPGWDDAGFAVTPMGGALHVFEFSGPQVMDLVARAAVIDPQNPGPCAAVSFAGVTSCLYRFENEDTLRLHLDRGLAGYIWSWCEAQPLFQEK